MRPHRGPARVELQHHPVGARGRRCATSETVGTLRPDLLRRRVQEGHEVPWLRTRDLAVIDSHFRLRLVIRATADQEATDVSAGGGHREHSADVPLPPRSPCDFEDGCLSAVRVHVSAVVELEREAFAVTEVVVEETADLARYPQCSRLVRVGKPSRISQPLVIAGLEVAIVVTIARPAVSPATGPAGAKPTAGPVGCASLVRVGQTSRTSPPARGVRCVASG